MLPTQGLKKKGLVTAVRTSIRTEAAFEQPCFMSMCYHGQKSSENTALRFMPSYLCFVPKLWALLRLQKLKKMILRKSTT